MPARLRPKLARAQRRQQVAELYLKGWSQGAIAEHLAIAQSTVCSDLRHIHSAWRESTIRDFDASRDLSLEKLNQVEREAWEAWQRSQQPSQTATVDGEGNGRKAKRTVKHQYGDPRFLELVLRCVDSRRQMLGLDAPTKIAPTTPDGQPLTLEQRNVHIQAILCEQFGKDAVASFRDAFEGQEDDAGTGPPDFGADERRGIDAAQPALGARHANQDTPSTPGRVPGP